MSTNPWKDSSKAFGGIDEILQMASAVGVFDKLVLDEKMLPVEPLKCKVDEYVSYLHEISSLEEQIDKITYEMQEIQFNMEYKDLLHSAELEKKATLLNDICDKIGNIVKNKRILTDLLQQKGGSSDALPLHRNFHKAFCDFFKNTTTLINNLPQNLATIEQASTMDPLEFRKHTRSLVDGASRLQKFYAEFEEASR